MEPEQVFALLSQAKEEGRQDYRVVALQASVQFYSAVAGSFPLFNTTTAYNNGKAEIGGINGWRPTITPGEITGLAKTFLEFLEGA